MFPANSSVHVLETETLVSSQLPGEEAKGDVAPAVSPSGCRCKQPRAVPSAASQHGGGKFALRSLNGSRPGLKICHLE